jgi:hypothetical protein
MATIYQDETQFVDDPQILEAIEQLKRKMDAVSDNFDANRTKVTSKKSAKIQKNAKHKAAGKSGKGKLKLLFLLIFLIGCSYVVAQITNTAITLQAPQATQQAQSPAPAQMPEAKLILKTASYEMLQSEIGRTLEITIVVANEGRQVGTPKQFVIELVDKEGKTVINWPMVVEGEPIEAGETRNFITRLIEPPTSFANIRVSMNK